MSGIFGILNIGKQAAFANQYAIQVTGNNIANVNTEGYSRQRVLLEANRYGLGVAVGSLQRIRDSFFDKQKISGMQEMGYLEVRSNLMKQMEEIFNESNSEGLSASINDFFKSLQDLSSNPNGTAEREMTSSQGTLLSDLFNSYYRQIESLQKDANKEIGEVVLNINSLASRIAELNAEIMGTQVDFPPTDLLDERNKLLNDLANLVDVNYFTDNNGSVNVFIGGGYTLIEGANKNTLETNINTENKGYSDVVFVDSNGMHLTINNKIRNGKLKGYLDIRDKFIPEQLKRLDNLASSLILNFNLQHRQGFGLDGNTGRDFFNMMAVYFQAAITNTGGARVTANSIADPTLLTLHDYQIQFTGPANYDIVDTTTGTTIVSGAAYTSGNPIIFDGISITITDNTGTPLAGDIFKVNTTTNAAKNIAVASNVLSDSRIIAAGLSTAEGDNENVLELAKLETNQLLNNNTANFSDYLSSQIYTIGTNSNQVTQQYDTQQNIMQQTENYIQSVSGISLDEEATNLIMYQRSFEASARIITTINDLLETVVNMIQ